MWFREEQVGPRGKRGNRRVSDGRPHFLMVKARMYEHKLAQRHRTAAILLMVVVMAGAVGLTIYLADLLERKLFSECDQFRIRHLELSSDGKLQPWHIREYAQLEEGQNLFALDIRKIRKDLESVPVVSSVTVSRRLPDTLVIKITERTAVARLGWGDGSYHLAIDREGYVLGPSSITPNLPTISGLKEKGLRPGSRIDERMVQDALRVLELSESIRLSPLVRVREIRVDQPDYLVLNLEKGEQVYLSRDNADIKLNKLAAILQSSAKKGITLASIDMTLTKNFPGKPQ